jgi:hypothetical protein
VIGQVIAYGWLPALLLFLARELRLQRRDETKAWIDHLARTDRRNR